MTITIILTSLKKILRLIKAIESNKQKRLTLGGCLVEKIGNFIEIQKEA